MPNATDPDFDDPEIDDETDGATPDPDHALPLRVLLRVLDFMQAEYAGPIGPTAVWRNGASGCGAIDANGESVRVEVRVESVDDEASDEASGERVLH